MQQTEKYKLNLIEDGDPFSHKPLDENAQKVEHALTENDGEHAALHAAIAATDARHAFEKLLTVNAVEGVTEATIDLSGVNFSDYAMMLIVYLIDDTPLNSLLRLDGMQLGVLLAGDGRLSGSGVSMLTPAIGRVNSITVFRGTGGKSGQVYTGYRDANWEDLTKLTVTNFINSSRLVVYGLRR